MVVDTDVVIRFLTGDDPIKSARFKKRLDCNEPLFLSDVTFAEIYWTLHSFYKFPNDKIVQALESLLNFDCVRANRLLLDKAVEILLESNLSFVDSYTATTALLENDGRVLSYDRGFDKIVGVTRKEP